jgi:hypothetical protein
MFQTLKNGARDVIASVPQEGHPTESAVTVLATGGTIPWTLRFYARFGTRRAYAGSVRTFPTKEQRVIAVCYLPGAAIWEVEGVGATNAKDEIAIHFEGDERVGLPPGVHAMLGNSVDGARSYAIATGTSGNVNITGEILGWAARTDVPGATVSITSPFGNLALGPIAVPEGGEVNGNGKGLIPPLSSWAFVNTTGYLIEYIPPGNVGP